MAYLHCADWDMIENTWTFPRYIALQEFYGEEGPPLELWAAAYFKFKGTPPERKQKLRGAAQYFYEQKALERKS